MQALHNHEFCSFRRQRMAVPEPEKTPADREEEEKLLHALVKVVEERDALVGYLEDLRQHEKKKDTELSSYMGLRGADEAELSVDEKLMIGATQESKLIWWSFDICVAWIYLLVHCCF